MIGADSSPEQQTLSIQQAIDLAVQHHAAGRLPEAEGIYQQILQAEPNHPVALHMLGVIAHQVGKNDLAVNLITQALAINPDFAEAHSNLGNALINLERLDEAVASYHKALAINPDRAEAHNNLGMGQEKLGKMDEAVASYHKALAINPDYAEAHYNLGDAFQGLGRLDEAAASYHKALAINPNYADVYNNLGSMLKKQGKLEEAIASYHKAIAIKPDHTKAHNNLGNAFRDQGKLEEAIASYHQVLAINPNFAEVHYNLGNAFKELGRLEESIASHHKALALKPDFFQAHSNLIFNLVYRPNITGDAILEEARRWDLKHSYCGEIARHCNTPDPERRLRIGYVSADFREHAVGYLLEPVLAEHDHKAVELFCYGEIQRPDHVTERLKGYADHWRSTVGVSDAKLADLIREDMIDIIVECTGFSANSRLLALTRKPAPILVSYFTMNGCTSGVATMDYVFSDPVLTPPGFEDQFSEEVVVLPQGAIAFRPDPKWPDVAPPPATDDGPLFACVGDPARIAPDTIRLWARLLKMVPNARILFKHQRYDKDQAREAWHHVFNELGEEALFEGIVGGWKENMDVYGRIDVVLDTLPMSGGLSCLIPMWMGVPVITMSSPCSSHRFGSEVITYAGMAELSADNTEDYLRIAADLINDLERLHALRCTMRDTIKASPIFDARGRAADIEAAYREMWRTWCQKKAGKKS